MTTTIMGDGTNVYLWNRDEKRWIWWATVRHEPGAAWLGSVLRSQGYNIHVRHERESGEIPSPFAVKHEPPGAEND